MKKTFAICVLLLLVVGCGDEKKDGGSPAVRNQSPATVAVQNETPLPAPTKTDPPTLVEAIQGKRVHFEINDDNAPPGFKNFQLWLQVGEGDQLAGDPLFTRLFLGHQTSSFHSKGHSLFTVLSNDGDILEFRFTKGKLSPGDPFQVIEHTHGVDLATVLASTDNSTDKHSAPAVILKIEEAQTEQEFDLEGSSDDEQPDEAEQPTKPVHSDLPVIELPSITNTLGMKLNKIPAGTFTMGSPEGEEGRYDREHQHKVTITKPFYMQTTEVTQGQWKAVMGTNPWKDEYGAKEGVNYPATCVSWNDAVAYCKKLSEKEGKTYRLPTEAEWEYACRAGTETRWSFGDDEKVLGDYAWYEGNAMDIGERYAHQVGLKKPNAFGLYDMHGNVFEWCHDVYGEDYYQQSSEKDPTGPTSGFFRVLRGGSWSNGTHGLRSARRGLVVAGRYYFYDGFRVVRELD
jgi:sulfatase modifying factor 1